MILPPAMTAIPPSVTEIVDVLTAMRGTVAVVLGGSRAVKSDDEKSERERSLNGWSRKVFELWWRVSPVLKP